MSDFLQYIESFWMKLVDFYIEEEETVLPLIGLYFQRLLNDVSSAKKNPLAKEQKNRHGV